MIPGKKRMSDREIFFRHLALTSFEPPALQFSHAEGIYLITPQGEKYTDLSAGYSVNNLGYNHPRIIEAIRQQAGLYLHQTVYGEFVQSPQVELALKVGKRFTSARLCISCKFRC